MTLNASEKDSVSKLVSHSKPSDLMIFHVHQTETKSAAVALDAIKSAIAKAKADYEIVLIKK